MDASPDISIVIVSWNVRDLLIGCLCSVRRELGGGLRGEVFVVDNASGDGTVAAVTEAFPEVRVLANDTNLGFVRANNQALARCTGRYVLLLNPDTEVREDALARLVAAADADPQLGAVGPRLLNGDGSVQPSRRRFPGVKTAVLESTVLERLFRQSATVRAFYVADRSDDEEQDVDWLVGACLLLRRSAIAQVGVLDERFFMYSEELDLCYRLRQAGWRVRYVPDAAVVHYEARSSEQVPVTRHFYFHDSRCRFFGKYRGRLVEKLLRGVVVANYAFLAGEDLAKLALGHKPELRRQRAAAYWQVARRHFSCLVSDGSKRGRCASAC
ncbi:MAG: glycosyltransferase family 2 protein [Chloroflexota bacterium]